MRALILALAVLTGTTAQTAGSEPAIGTRPPEWQVTEWINSAPLRLSDLRGKVVVVRWFTSADCPYCSATAPALNDWHRRLAARGLAVVGLYHHKRSAPFRRHDVDQAVADYGFRFPVGIDDGWKTLHSWWLDRTPRGAWSSVTFVIDRTGVVRHIHPGGQYVRGDSAHKRLERVIEDLLD